MLGPIMVTFYIGKDEAETQFHIHKNLLCEKAPELAKLFNEEDSKSSESHIIKFLDEDPQAFGMFVELLYTNFEPIRSLCTGTEAPRATTKYIKTYCFAETWKVSNMFNVLIGYISSSVHMWGPECIDVQTLKWAFGHTPMHSKLRLLLTEYVGFFLSGGSGPLLGTKQNTTMVLSIFSEHHDVFSGALRILETKGLRRRMFLTSAPNQ